MTTMEWHGRAACTAKDRAVFDKAGKSATAEAEAKAVCGRCPVRAECLYDALEHDARGGVWGGLTGAERRALPALPKEQPVTVQALKDLLDEIDQEGGPQAARDNRLTLTHERPEPMSTAPELAIAPSELVTIKPPVMETARPPLPVGALLKWADGHDDKHVRDQAARARTDLDELRTRHAADQELAHITSQTEQLEKQLAEPRARQAELTPTKAKRKTGVYARDYDTRTVRAWAQDNGVDCPGVGQIPKRVLDAWRAATGSEPTA